MGRYILYCMFLQQKNNHHCGKTLVTLSVLTVFGISTGNTHVLGAPVINCSQGFDFGVFVANCNSSITIQADVGGTVVSDSCFLPLSGTVQGPACTINTAPGPATRSVRVTVSVASLGLTNGGTGAMTLDNFMIQTASGSQAAPVTFGPTALNDTITANIGGRLNFSTQQPSGSYDNSITINVNSIP